jgi:hypothetical protein
MKWHWSLQENVNSFSAKFFSQYSSVWIYMQFNILGSNIKLDKVHAFSYFMYLCGICKSVWPLSFLCGLGLSSIPGAHSLMCGGLQKWWGEAWNLSPPVSLQCLCIVRRKPQQHSKQLSTHTHSYCNSIHIWGVLNILHNRYIPDLNTTSAT